MMEGRLRCGVTGSNGYLGTRIKKYLRAGGHEVFELRRKLPETEENRKSVIPFVLGHDLMPGALAKLDVLIHCAYDFSLRRWDDIYNVNVDGTLKLFETARDDDVGRIIFISSMSAFTGCRSMYGRAKLEVERRSADLDVISIRPGLIYGDEPAGIFGAMTNVIKKSPLVPLVGLGGQVQYLVHDEDLCEFIYKVCAMEDIMVDRPITAASDQPVTFKKILKGISGSINMKSLFIPVPYFILWTGLRFVEVLGMKPGFRSDSLVGLVYGDPTPDFTLPPELTMKFRRFEV
jgi:nucleoside-diphosphate-sugar epimerase